MLVVEPEVPPLSMVPLAVYQIRLSYGFPACNCSLYEERNWFMAIIRLLLPSTRDNNATLSRDILINTKLTMYQSMLHQERTKSYGQGSM